MTEKEETPNQYEKRENFWFGLACAFSVFCLTLLLAAVFINRDFQEKNKQLNAKIVQIQEENEELKKELAGFEIKEGTCIATFEKEGGLFVWIGDAVIYAKLNRKDIDLPTINVGDTVYIAYRLKDFSDAEVIGGQPK